MLDIVGEASGGTDPTLLQSVKTVVNKEMKDYQNAAALVLQTSPGVWSNPLDWWRANHCKFLLHAQLARIHLATQATSAPSERVFSVASRCISKVRTNMDPTRAGQLEFLHDNWKDWENDLKVLRMVATTKFGNPKE